MKRKSSGGSNKGKRQKCHALVEPGMYGVYATCPRFKEVAAAKELRTLLKEGAEKWYPKEEGDDVETEAVTDGTTEGNTDTANKGGEGSGGYVEDEIAKELAELNKQNDLNKNNRNSKDIMIREIPLGIESLVFFKMRQPIIPSKFVMNLCKDLNDGTQISGRFVQKVTPIDHSCNATEVEFDKLLNSVIDNYIEENGIDSFESYNVNLVKRNFDLLSRDEVMAKVKEILDSKMDAPVTSQLKYKGAKTLIHIYCYKNNIGSSVVSNTDFESLYKCNLQSINGAKIAQSSDN